VDAKTKVCDIWLKETREECGSTDSVRHYQPGMRCPLHTPRALQGLPEIEPGLGWPIHQKRVRTGEDVRRELGADGEEESTS
jgi:hypothetical protein